MHERRTAGPHPEDAEKQSSVRGATVHVNITRRLGAVLLLQTQRCGCREDALDGARLCRVDKRVEL